MTMIQTPVQAKALPGNAEHRARVRDLLAAVGVTHLPTERKRPAVTLVIRSERTRREIRDAQATPRISDEAAETFGVELDVPDEGTIRVTFGTDNRATTLEDWLAWATRDIPAGYHVVGMRGERGTTVEWTPGAGDAAAGLEDARAEVVSAEAHLAEARARRDAAIVTAADAGLTAYRIAKILGVAESTVGRILAREDQP